MSSSCKALARASMRCFYVRKLCIAGQLHFCFVTTVQHWLRSVKEVAVLHV